MKDNNLIVITYLIYIVFFEGLVLGGCGYVVFWLGYSGVWFLLAGIIGGCAYSPDRWHSLLTGKPKD